MHVRYADNTREASWRDRAGKEGPPAFLIDALSPWLFCYLPSCCATVRPNNISSAHRLMSVHTPCAAFQDRGNRGTTALRRSTCHIYCVTRKVRCSACIDLHGVMTPAHPHTSPAPLGLCRTLPAPPLPRHSHTLVPLSSTIGRRYLSMPTRCYLERFTGLTAAREWWWGDRLMQNTWLIGEVLRAS